MKTRAKMFNFTCLEGQTDYYSNETRNLQALVFAWQLSFISSPLCAKIGIPRIKSVVE